MAVVESGEDRLPPAGRAVLVVALLYVFLVGISLLEAGIGALGSGFQEGLLESVANPIAGLCAGILATLLVQSSSVSTSAIVGLVGAGTLTVPPDERAVGRRDARGPARLLRRGRRS